MWFVALLDHVRAKVVTHSARRSQSAGGSKGAVKGVNAPLRVLK